MKIFTTINNILRSRRFSVFIMVFFLFESAWIGLSAIYPQAFDEDFHFGLIQIYSHYWLPFLSSQPAHANAYGAVARDPSYLYHYLMSFPYRFISLFVHGQTGQVILLRFINIGLFASGLVLFRRVLLKAGSSLPLTNITLLLFILIPITPQLAAQINYDNLLIPLVGWVCLLTFKAIDELKSHQPTVKTLLTLLGVCLLSSLVKYEFMPIFMGVVIYLIFMAHQYYRGNYRHLGSLILKNWRKQSWYLKTALISLVLVSTGMFIERDAVNIVKYHTISPDCSAVLSVKDCSAYSVWNHDYTSHKSVVSKTAVVDTNPVTYFTQWVYWVWYRLFFAINGPYENFTNYPPLPLPSIGFMLIGFAAIVAIIKWRRHIFENNPYIIFLAIITVLYLAALLAEGYLEYRYTDVLELMNGRYVLPILPLVAAIVGSSFSVALRSTPRLKGAIAIVAIVLFVQGGGFLTFIARSDSTWYWSSPAVQKVNNAAKKITKPVLIKGKKTYTTHIWFFN